jgi:hypothetical protein
MPGDPAVSPSHQRSRQKLEHSSNQGPRPPQTRQDSEHCLFSFVAFAAFQQSDALRTRADRRKIEPPLQIIPQDETHKPVAQVAFAIEKNYGTICAPHHFMMAPLHQCFIASRSQVVLEPYHFHLTHNLE